ncbi:concanavalin A-like lectin/glucanase domain-containing protein [Cladochytrium replicatum]|nr:concanavalin A-like lectin/glucanase domain-containing protein [Cladochytrium replicatum]
MSPSSASLLAIAVLSLATLATAQNATVPNAPAGSQCGYITGTTGVTKCKSDQPCCSEFWMCGAAPSHCGGGCFPDGSASPSACLNKRSGGQTCQSGFYRFDNSTWVVPSDAYNGNPLAADFTIDRAGLDAKGYMVDSTGRARLSLVAPANANLANDKRDAGTGVRLSSTSYLPYGKVTARLRASSAGGAVTAFITMADDRDEIDWEFTGDTTVAWTNVFLKGQLDYTQGKSHWPGQGSGKAKGGSITQTVREYTIDWNESRILFQIDGETVRTVNKGENPKGFPVSPARVQFAIWDGGAMGSGTRDWAGGYIDWSKATTDQLSGIFEWVRIQCPGDPVPTSTPSRPSGMYAPYIYAPPINSVVEGFGSYDPTTVGAGKPGPANVITAQAAKGQTITGSQDPNKNNVGGNNSTTGGAVSMRSVGIAGALAGGIAAVALAL